jgi:hypothetical protein
MSTKFSDFLQTQKIDPRRLAAASARIERLRPEDRKAKLARRQAKASETKVEGAEAPPKPRSGKPVTDRLLAQALGGKPMPSAGKTRLLRAVNRVLEQQKKEPVDLRALFGSPAKAPPEAG